MNVHADTPAMLPDWVQDAIESGQPSDGPLRRRAEPRRLWSLTCSASPLDRAGGRPISVCINNVCSSGIGFISLTPLPVGQWRSLSPTYLACDAAIRGRVVHCAPIVQGYRIGCAFAPAERRARPQSRPTDRFADFEPEHAGSTRDDVPAPMLL